MASSLACCNPLAGRVPGHRCLCSNVPSASLRGWHRDSVVHVLVLARRACGHWPPAMADSRAGLYFGVQSSNSLVPADLDLSSLLMTSAKPRNTAVAPVLVQPLPVLSSGLSGATRSVSSGRENGKICNTLRRRHLFTERLTASATAIGGSNVRSQQSPTSSCRRWASRKVQPILCVVATRAATGSVTRYHTDAVAADSLRTAYAKRLPRKSGLRHDSHHAIAPV